MTMPCARSRRLPAVLAGAGCLFALGWLVHPTDPIDLRVYLAGAHALLAHADVTAAHPVGSALPFTYPPFAALCYLPLLALPGLAAASAAQTTLSLAALLLVVRQCLRAIRPQWTVRRGWLAGAAVTAAALPLEPVRATLAFGQVNLVLLAMVLTDLLALPTRRYRGALIGLAAGIKLTPAIFILHLALTRQRPAARTAALTGLGTILLGWLLAPASAVRYWTRLVFEPGRVGGVAYAGNQSLYGLAARLGHGEQALRGLWLDAVVVVAATGLAAAARAHRAGAELAAAGLAGLTGLLVSPVSWSHHWVWIVPVAVALVPLRRWLAAAVLALFYAGPIWWVPRTGNAEYHHHGVQLLTGNAYLLAGLALLAAGAVRWRGGTPPGPRVAVPSLSERSAAVG